MTVLGVSTLRFLLGVTVFGFSLGGCAAKKDDKGPPPAPEAGYVVLKAETVPLFIELTGRTSAYETSDVRPQVAGLILARTFQEGSIVHAGQTLYKIDPAQYRAALAQAQANLASAQANAVSSRAKADRYKPLADIEAVAKQDYVDQRALAEQAAAAVSQTRAAVAAAKINLGFTDIPAPITGRVGRSVVTTGGLVTVGQTMALTTIQRLNPIFVDIQQSSADLLTLRHALASGDRVASSAAVKVELGDGSEYPAVGRIEFSEAMVDPNTGTVTLRARFANPHGVLLPGMFVRARLSQETARDAILAPQAGIARDAKGRATALIVGQGNKAVSRDVKVDRTIGDQWLVTSGLAAGDKLIVEGLNKVKPGQPIKPVPAGSKPNSKPAGGDNASSGAKS